MTDAGEDPLMENHNQSAEYERDDDGNGQLLVVIQLHGDTSLVFLIFYHAVIFSVNLSKNQKNFILGLYKSVSFCYNPSCSE